MMVPIEPKKPWTIKKAIHEATSRKEMMEEMGAAYMSEGLVTLAGSRLYTSAADTDEIIDDALASFRTIFERVEKPETL